VNRKPTAQTTNLPRGRRGHANHANGAYPSLAPSRLGVNRLFGSGFEPQTTQRFTEESMSHAKAQRAQRPGSNPLAASRLGVRRLSGSGFAVGPGVDRAVPVAAPGGRGAFDPARSASAPTAGRRKHQIIGLTPFPIATSTRWPTGSKSVGPGVDRAGFEPTDHRLRTSENDMNPRPLLIDWTPAKPTGRRNER
jgi:hypothetical protein